VSSGLTALPARHLAERLGRRGLYGNGPALRCAGAGSLNRYGQFGRQKEALLLIGNSQDREGE
jgi:hypothetical protein